MGGRNVVADYLGHKLGETFMRVQHFTPVRNVLLGGGMAFAISEEKYLHAPVAVVFPSIYVGYMGYKHRDRMASYARSLQAGKGATTRSE